MNDTFWGRIKKVLFYSDTRFYELISGISMMSIGFIILFPVLTSPSSPVAIEVIGHLHRWMWSMIFMLSGIFQFFGSIGKPDWPRFIGNGLTTILWIGLALMSFYAKGLIWSVFFLFGLKQFWTLMRVALDRVRPLKGDII